MNVFFCVLALFVVALIGWAVAEFKGKFFGYTVSEEEIEAAHHEAAPVSYTHLTLPTN